MTKPPNAPNIPNSEINLYLDILKKIYETKCVNGAFKSIFICPEATIFNKIVNQSRNQNSQELLDIHNHEPEYNENEKRFASNKLISILKEKSTEFDTISSTPNEIIYGDRNNVEKQITYKLVNGTWNITAGNQVEAIIIDPEGKLIDIKPGNHITVYGNAGNLNIENKCTSHNHNHNTQQNQNSNVQNNHNSAHEHSHNAHNHSHSHNAHNHSNNNPHTTVMRNTTNHQHAATIAHNHEHGAGCSCVHS